MHKGISLRATLSQIAKPQGSAKIALLRGRIFVIGLFLCTSLLICAMGGRSDPGMAMGKSGSIMDLKAVYDLCRPSPDCDTSPDWEGRRIVFAGYLDPDNVFFKANYPQLPYEKFVIIDKLGRSIEVWPQGSDNDPLYAKLMRRPSDRIVVNGRLKSFKMPVGDTCTRGAKVVMDNVDQIQFIAD